MADEVPALSPPVWQREPAPALDISTLPGPPPGQIKGPIVDAPDNLLPLTSRAVAAQGIGGRIAQRVSNLPSFEDRNVAEGVPLDTETGIPTWNYLMTKMNRLQQDRLSYLKGIYGDENVRVADTGEPIVRVVGEDGKPRDIKISPEHVTLRDVADLGAFGGEMAGAAIAAYFNKPGPLIQTIKNAARTAIAQETGGALQDFAVRGIQGQDIRPGEIAGTRALQVPMDIGAELFMGGATKVAGKAVSPFADPLPAQFNLQDAKARIRARYGVDLPNTPGELTGNSLLLRSEAFARQKPGSSGPIQAITDAADRAIQKVQDIMLGRAPAQTAEETGGSAIEAIRAKLFPQQSAIEGLKKEIAEGTTVALKGAAQTATGLGAAPNKSMLGEAIREAAYLMRDAWKAASGYEEFFSNPITKAENISAKSVSERAQELLKAMPGETEVTRVPVGLVDARGVPITRDVEGREVWKEFIPERVVARLQRLAGSPNAKLSLDQLKQMRTEVDDDILVGEAVPGVRNFHLKNVRSMLTDAMNEGVESFGDPTLVTEWKRINTEYAKNVPRFEQKGIAELFHDPQSGNWIGNQGVVNRAMRDPDVYHEYVKFFGANSPMVLSLKRSVAEDVLSDAINPISGLVDGKTFINNLRALVKNSPEMAKDAFGPDITRLYGIASVETASKLGERDRAAMLIRRLNGKVDLGDLQELLRSGEPTAQKLVDLVNAQNKLGDEFRNTIKRTIAEGGPIAEKIEPSKFVDYVSRQGEPSHIKEVMAMLSDRPDITESIRRQTLMDILGRARSSAEALKHEFGKPGTLTAGNLEEAMGFTARGGGKAQMDRYRAILGDETWQDLTDLGHALQPREAGASTFGTAGRLSAGSQISQLEKGKLFTFLDTVLRNYVIASIYASPLMRKFISNTAITPQGQAALVNYAVSSTPFIEALIETYGEPIAREKAAQLKYAIDQSLRQSGGGGTSTNATPLSLSPPEWKKGMK